MVGVNEQSLIQENRAQEEEVELSPDALALLTKIGKETSLRYGSHLITTANLIAAKRKANVVAIQDVQRAYTLFYDQARSVKVCSQWSIFFAR